MSNQNKWYMVKNSPEKYNICMECNGVGNVKFGNSKAVIHRCKFCGSDKIMNMSYFKDNRTTQQLTAFEVFRDKCGMGMRARF